MLGLIDNKGIVLGIFDYYNKYKNLYDFLIFYKYRYMGMSRVKCN